MLKKNITSMMLLTFSACVSAQQQDVNFKSDFTYPLSCEQNGCYSSNYYTDSVGNPFSLSLNDASSLKLDEHLPKYLMVQDTRDWDYLKGQTYTILGLSVMTAGLMTLLPESITKWDAEDRKLSGLGKKWKDNVTSGPTWDRDEHFLNYISTHTLVVFITRRRVMQDSTSSNPSSTRPPCRRSSGNMGLKLSQKSPRGKIFSSPRFLVL